MVLASIKETNFLTHFWIGKRKYVDAYKAVFCHMDILDYYSIA